MNNTQFLRTDIQFSNTACEFDDYLSPQIVRKNMVYIDITVLSFEESLTSFSHDNKLCEFRNPG